MSGNERGHAGEHEQHDQQECKADCFQIHNLHAPIIQRSTENTILIICKIGRRSLDQNKRKVIPPAVGLFPGIDLEAVRSRRLEDIYPACFHERPDPDFFLFSILRLARGLLFTGWSGRPAAANVRKHQVRDHQERALLLRGFDGCPATVRMDHPVTFTLKINLDHPCDLFIIFYYKNRFDHHSHRVRETFKDSASVSRAKYRALRGGAS